MDYVIDHFLWSQVKHLLGRTVRPISTIRAPHPLRLTEDGRVPQQAASAGDGGTLPLDEQDDALATGTPASERTEGASGAGARARPVVGPTNLARSKERLASIQSRQGRRVILQPKPPDKRFTNRAMRQAWLAVKAAKGGAGVDGMTLQKFEENLAEELASIRLELVNRQYQPRPVRQVLVPKASEGWRPLVMWALRDRVAQRVIYDQTMPTFESLFLPCSFGFRPGLGVPDAVRQVEAYRDINLRWIVDADIKSCFDEINPQQLISLVRRRVKDPTILLYVERWLRAQIMNSLDGRPRQAGTGQGGVLSPLFANIYLHEMDCQLIQKGYALVRYADDFVICCRRKAEAEAALQEAAQALQRLGLELNQHKTRIIHMDEGIHWLGYFLVRRETHRL